MSVCLSNLSFVSASLARFVASELPLQSLTKKDISSHSCPCCSYILLRHLRWRGIYWRCSHCYQEMPAF